MQWGRSKIGVPGSSRAARVNCPNSAMKNPALQRPDWHNGTSWKNSLNYSRPSARGFLSVLRPTNLICRTRFESVHSRNSKFATSSGRTQVDSRVFVAVSPWPHRPGVVSGRFANGQIRRGQRLQSRIQSSRCRSESGQGSAEGCDPKKSMVRRWIASMIFDWERVCANLFGLLVGDALHWMRYAHVCPHNGGGLHEPVFSPGFRRAVGLFRHLVFCSQTHGGKKS